MSVSGSAPFLAPITLLQTAKLVFGCGCLDGCAADLRLEGLKRSLILTPPIAGLANPLLDALRSGGSAALVIDSLAGEPTIESFEEILEQARGFQPDRFAKVGIWCTLSAGNSARISSSFVNLVGVMNASTFL